MSEEINLDQISSASMEDLPAIRARLSIMKKQIETQLALNKNDHAISRQRLIQNGMHPREADWRASGETDTEWRGRASTKLRLIDSALGQIRTRLTEANNPPGRPFAIAIPRCSTPAAVCSALNQMADRGSKVFAFAVVGSDLVVMATEPKS